MKNIDKLKQLDVKDFARILSTATCYYCIYKGDKGCDTFSNDCEKGVIEFLEKEVED